MTTQQQDDELEAMEEPKLGKYQSALVPSKQQQMSLTEGKELPAEDAAS